MKTILVPVDFSDVVPRVLETACAMAKSTGAEITLLHVMPPEPAFIGYDPGPASVRTAVAREFTHEKQEMEKLAATVKERGFCVRVLVIQGFPAEKILAEAGKLHADAIVMGSHGRGMLHHLLVGNVTEGVLRKSACPVTVVPARG